MNKRSSLAMAAVLAASCAFVTRANNLGVSFDYTTVEFSNGEWSLGWSFSLTQPVVVTALGAFDGGQNGLSSPLAVGLWDTGGSLLASATVPGGTSGDLVNWFRFTDIVPLELGVGTYVVAAESRGENYSWDPAGTVFGPEVVFGEDRYILGSDLQFPDVGSFGVTGWFGGNFQYSSVPEASPFAPALVLLGGAAILARRRQVSAKS